jgi:hypothetical protein
VIDDPIDPIRRLADLGGHRFDPLPTHRFPLVAVAGGTGSGKSSLVNALAGDAVSLVGELRPTTSEALAVFPEDATTTAAPVLDRLGVIRRLHGRHRGVVLVDLPDLDSVVEGHRRVAEAVLGLADAVVWVVDPEKYADAVLHATVRRFDDVPSIVACNHADRLTGHERLEVLGDVARRFGAREVVPTSVPRAGVPTGVDALSAWMSAVEVDAVDPSTRRLARRWVEEAGPPHHPPAVEAWTAVERDIGAFIERCTDRAVDRLSGAGVRQALLGRQPAPPASTAPPETTGPPDSWPRGTSAVRVVEDHWGPAASRLADAADAAALMADSAVVRPERWWPGARWAIPLLVGAAVVAVVGSWWLLAVVAVVVALGLVVGLTLSGRVAGRRAVDRLHLEVGQLRASAWAAAPVVEHRTRCSEADELAAAATAVSAVVGG